MTPTGGMTRGIPVLTSDQMPSGTALLLDASQIAANQGEVEISTSQQAAVEMLDTVSLDASPEESDTLVSLWQHNPLGIRANRTFGYRLLRSTAAASLSGVSY